MIIIILCDSQRKKSIVIQFTPGLILIVTIISESTTVRCLVTTLLYFKNSIKRNGRVM